MIVGLASPDFVSISEVTDVLENAMMPCLNNRTTSVSVCTLNNAQQHGQFSQAALTAE